jgi:cell wall-associated NlpC family hydrolase
MCRIVACGSRYRGRGIRHDGFFPLGLARTAAAGAALLLLAACAVAPRGVPRPAESPAPPAPAERQPAAVQSMIATAASMIGQPYRFGGASPGGFDCSGLVEFAALSAGIRMPRTAAEQFRIGSSIDRADLQAGDLVFMHLAGKELHVAIALDAQLFVHAPSSGGFVRVDSLIAAPYAKGFLGARRVVSFAAPH